MPKVKFVCKYCQKDFFDFPVRNRKCCSEECHRKWFSENQMGENNPSKRQDVREKLKKAHTGIKNGINTRFKKGNIISEEGIKKRKDFWNMPEMKKFARERRAKQIFPLKDSSIEVKIQSFLKQLNIEFFTPQYIHIEHSYQCDILIPSLNLVIECDCDYWHKYPIGTEIDYIRTSELLQKGFKVLRLWEFEINKMSINDFVRRLNK